MACSNADMLERTTMKSASAATAAAFMFPPSFGAEKKVY